MSKYFFEPEVVNPMDKPVVRLVFEVFEKNKKPFDDYLNEHLLRAMAEASCHGSYEKLAGPEVVPGQCLRFCAVIDENEWAGGMPLRNLNLLPELTLYDYPDFYDRSKFDVYKYRFLNFHDAVYKMGQPVIVTALDTLYRVTDDDIKDWLAVFGPLKKLTSYDRPTAGLSKDSFQFQMVLDRHVPQYLPIKGYRIRISYPGQPKQCTICYSLGHIESTCLAEKEKDNWTCYVVKMMKSKAFPEHLF